MKRQYSSKALSGTHPRSSSRQASSSPIKVVTSTTSTMQGLEETISDCMATPPFNTQYLPTQHPTHDLPTPPAEDERGIFDHFNPSAPTLESPSSFALLGQDPPIYALTAEEYNMIHESHTCADPLHHAASARDEEALWPFLHGVGGTNTAQNSFFSCQNSKHSAMAPKYRGLTTVCAEASCLSDVQGRSRSSSDASQISSAASSSTCYSSAAQSISSAGDASHHPTVRRGPSYTPHKSQSSKKILCSQLISSVSPSDILQPRRKSVHSFPKNEGAMDTREDETHWCFPAPVFEKPNVNLRAFKIQPAQYASISDIVIYGERGPTPQVMKVARQAASAIAARRRDRGGRGLEYNVFVIIDPFERFEDHFPHLVAVTGLGECRNTIDFQEREREEMQFLTRASPISANGNVWLGNASDSPALPCLYATDQEVVESSMIGRDSAISLLGEDKEEVRQRELLQYAKNANPNRFEISIDTQDSSAQWGPREFSMLAKLLDSNEMVTDPTEPSAKYPLRVCDVDFSVQGLSPRQDCLEVYLVALMHIIEFIHYHSVDKERRILIHCGDGYTESSILALAYVMYDRQCSLPEAYLIMQNDCSRSFFVYQADVKLLQRIETRVRQFRMTKYQASTDCSTVSRTKEVTPYEERSAAEQLRQRYPWFFSPKFEGSFPSRILPFLYLGNLNHAANATMLRDLGITHVLSVGENAGLPPRRRAMNEAIAQENEEMGFEVLYLSNLYDDGIDSLTRHVDRCLEFIEDARTHAGKVLVHCRVGVSRSATITMAYIMKHLDLPVVPAYLLVRARRLSTIVQPNLRFLYELLQFEGRLRGKRSVGWSWLAKEVACLNSIYSIV